jgi:ABC-type Fe3+-hydroxamate transport system substrate-binding protein
VGEVRDDTGVALRLPDGGPGRVVSLVPSLTETLAVSAPRLLVGATDWCTHPADLDVVRVRGTKNPDVDAVVALAPDLVVANEEENREVDLQALRDNGIAVWTTQVRTVDEALTSLGRLLEVCGAADVGWLGDARAAWTAAVTDGPRRRAVVPIWRRPWMALGRDTFAGDVLRRLGVDNVLARSPERYPRVDLADLADRADLADLPSSDMVVLPSEPYAFGPDDGPEAFPHHDCALVDGRLLTWYGPSLVEAPAELRAQLDAVLPAGR